MGKLYNGITSDGLQFSRVNPRSDDSLERLLIEIDWDNVTPKTIFDKGKQRGSKEGYSQGFEVGKKVGRADSKHIRNLNKEIKQLRATLKNIEELSKAKAELSDKEKV